MKINSYDTSEEALKYASDCLISHLKNAREKYFREKQNILFLLSGGSAFSLLENIDKKYLGPHLTMAVLDERYTNDPDINNFSQLTYKDFYLNCVASKCNFIDTQIRGIESLQQLAERLDRSLKDWVRENPESIVIATMGMGADGHAAGIMPYPENSKKFTELFIKTDNWVVGYDAGDKNIYPKRITVTVPFLRYIHHVVSFVTGGKKMDTLKKLTTQNGSLEETPARIMREMKDVQIFTDITASEDRS